MAARDLFGVVVHSIGLLVFLVGASALFFGLTAMIFSGPGGVGFLLYSLPYLAVGAALFVKAEWLVCLAYGPRI